MTTTRRNTTRMPVLFAGHGSPMNAIEDNHWSEGFRELAEGIARPDAILMVSAHWYTRGTFLTGENAPKTIHDFSGFPRPLYEVNYPAKGSPTLATQVSELLRDRKASLRSDWGLDHGSWSVLKWMFPDAEVPVVQLSINQRLGAEEHLAVGAALRELRDQGVLIIGSGNITHNLGDAISRMQSGDLTTPTWARDFDTEVAKALEQHDERAIASMSSHDAFRRAHPSPDHWLPLLYALGAAGEASSVRFSSAAFDLGSLSMRNVIWE